MSSEESTEIRQQVASIRGLPVAIAVVAWFATYLTIGGGLTALFGIEATLQNMTLGGLLSVYAAFGSAFIASPSVYWWIHSRPIWPNLKKSAAEMAVHGAVAVAFSIGVLVLLAIGLGAVGVIADAVC